MFNDQEIPQITGAQEVQALHELPEKEAVVGFFELLIAVDRRINPELYD